MFLHRCQPTRLGLDESRGAWKSKTKTGFKAVSCSFLLSLSFFLACTGRGWKLLNLPTVIAKKKKKRCELQRRSVVASYNVVATRAIAPQRRQPRVAPQPHELQRHSVAATCSTATSQLGVPQRRNNTICSDVHCNAMRCSVVVSCNVEALQAVARHSSHCLLP